MEINKTFKGLLRELPDNGIFVYFSNIKGDCSKGTAKIAKELFGAIEERAFHTQGQSYAICFRFVTEVRVEESFMKNQIALLYCIAKSRDKDKLFYIMYNGNVSIANYTPRDIVNLFNLKEIPDNIIFEEDFYKIFNSKTRFELETEV